MSTRLRSAIHSAAILGLAAIWLAASLSCGEEPSVALPRGSICDRGVFTRGDLYGILRGPIDAARRVPGDRESCAFTTAGHSRLEIRLRRSGGKGTVERWIAGAMALEAVPVRGVGDLAAWQRDLHEVIAEKDDALCDISVMGTEGDFVDASEFVLEDRIGNLCNKVFDSAPAPPNESTYNGKTE